MKIQYLYIFTFISCMLLSYPGGSRTPRGQTVAPVNPDKSRQPHANKPNVIPLQGNCTREESQNISPHVGNFFFPQIYCLLFYFIFLFLHSFLLSFFFLFYFSVYSLFIKFLFTHFKNNIQKK